MAAWHPKCGRTIPGGNSGGHCAACCRDFRGEAAFDRHLARLPDGRVSCTNPAAATDSKGRPRPYWQDERGAWHLGPRRDPNDFKESA